VETCVPERVRRHLACRHRARSRVPLANVYYYFKTKDEIGDAIVELRLAQLSAQRQRWKRSWIAQGSALRCVQAVFENRTSWHSGLRGRDVLSELHKEGGSVATRATEIFANTWPGSKASLGTREGERVQRPCLHLLFRHARRFDPAHTFMTPSCGDGDQRLKSWIQSL